MTIYDDQIKQLEAIAQRTDLPYERRLTDTALWFVKNKDRIPRDNLAARMDFAEKTMEIFIELLAMSLERMQEAEGRSHSSSLWLPNGINFSGDPTRFD